MGIFSRKEPSMPDAGWPVLFPGGATPDLDAPGALEMNYTMTVARREEMNIPIEDAASWSTVALAYENGLPESELALAWGDVWVGWANKGKRFEGEAVVTPLSVFISWKPRVSRLVQTFEARHWTATEVAPTSPTEVAYTWGRGIWMDDGGIHHMRNPSLVIGMRFGADGHANRRTITLCRTMPAVITESFGDGSTEAG